MTSLLRTEALTKRYGSLVVTKDVDLAIEAGERHVVIGPNGAGKTSLVHQLSGQIRPSSGKIFFDGRDITAMEPEQICRAGIGRTFQKNNLFRSLSVRENVRLAVQALKGSLYNPFKLVTANRAERDTADALLEQVQLHGRSECLVSELSYGEQRQLEIALGLASEPKLLLLDEPTSGMSPAETDAMIDLVRSLPKDIALLIVEHDMKVVFALADRITVMYYGEVLASDTPAAISNNQRVSDVYLGGHA